MNTCTHPQPSQRIIRLVRQDVATWCSTCGALRPLAQDWMLPESSKAVVAIEPKPPEVKPVAAAPAPKEDPEVLCFGCIGSPGHSLYSPTGKLLSLQSHHNPWSTNLDGGLLRGTIPDNIDGQFVTEHLDGWTAVSFWDRSGDGRPNSSTTFLIRAMIGGDDLLKLAKRQWAELFKRPGFPIK